MYATPQYYHELQAAFSNPKLVKQEMLDDLIDIDRPVDMSLSSLHHKTKSSPDIPRDLNHVSYENGQQLYASYVNSFPREAHENLPTNNNNNKMEHAQLSVLEPRGLSLSTSTSPPGQLAVHFKGSDGNLTIPTIMTKNKSFSAKDEVTTHHRARREFVPDSKKDDSYWCKRLKNNDSARRSRVKRKAIEKMMETKLLELQKENILLKHEVAALRRRYGEEEETSSDSSSSREKVSPNSPVSPPSPTEESSGKGEDEHQSSGSDDARSNDDSRVYSMRSVSVLNHTLDPASRDRADSVSSSSSSNTSGRVSTDSTPEYRSPHMGYMDTGSCRGMTGALDLTSDHCNNSTSAWESSSLDSFRSLSTNSTRRSSCVSSDSSSHDDGNRRTMVYPFKCRWKKGAHSV